MKVSWLSEGRFVVADFDESRLVLAIRRDDPEKPDLYLLPGFVDAHCHGYGGWDVMEGGAVEVGAALRDLGVEWWCPTTVAGSWAEIREVLHGLGDRVTGCAGAHLEGPFLSRRYPGVQPIENLRTPQREEMEAEIGQFMGRARVVTLAPELPGAGDVLRGLIEAGVTPSAGHTDASYAEMQAAFQLGLRRVTHFYNAMRPFHHRDPGCVGFGLMNEVTCELIYDRHHISREAASLLWAARGPYGVVGVSDGTKLAGLPDDSEVEMWDKRVRKEGGAARLPDGRLAGSAVSIADVFRNLWEDFGPGVAAMMCCYNPRRDLSLPEARLWLLVDGRGRVAQSMEGDLRVEG